MDINEILLAELDMLYRFAFNRTRNEYKAEELVQEICAAALYAYPRLRDKTSVMPWLWGIAKNMYLRSLNPAPEFPLPVEEIETGSIHLISYDTPESEYLRKADAIKVRTALSRLAKMYRDVCVLFYLEEKDYNTIAKELDIPLSSVKWRLNQSKVQLKKEIEKMDYMEKGYHKAAKLCFAIGCRYYGSLSADEGPNGARKSLDSLLAQNICLAACREAKTVTELSSELGVAADYIEDTLEKLIKHQTVRMSGNKYRAAFPILSEAEYSAIYEENIAAVKRVSADLFDKLLGLKEKIRAVGFYGSENPMETLLTMLLSIICEEISDNAFPSHLLPFHNDCAEWHVLGVINHFPELSCKGIGTSCYGNTNHVTEYFFGSSNLELNKEEADAVYRIYSGASDGSVSEAVLAALIEKRRIVKTDSGYKIAVPVLSAEEKAQLTILFAPIIEQASGIQKELIQNTKKNVTKIFPDHLKEQIPFFAEYLASHTVDSVLLSEMERRGIRLADNTPSWFVIKA